MKPLPDGQSSSHIPVLLDEVLENLVQSLSGTYVDATFGRGGHSRALLARLNPEARVIGLDRDDEAVAEGARLASEDSRFEIHHSRFSAIAEYVDTPVEGVLLDIGVSSPQLDRAQRGFSFLKDGPLDMRMDRTAGRTAQELIDELSEQDLAAILFRFGEERHARRIAAAICRARPVTGTVELATIVSDAVPARYRHGAKHPATRTFQALRIYLNDEEAELQEGLRQSFSLLRAGGRLAVITFHSLEDRIVKRYFRSLTRPPELPRQLPLREDQLVVEARDVAGPLKAGRREVDANPRARSATLRVIERHG